VADNATWPPPAATVTGVVSVTVSVSTPSTAPSNSSGKASVAPVAPAGMATCSEFGAL